MFKTNTLTWLIHSIDQFINCTYEKMFKFIIGLACALFLSVLCLNGSVHAGAGDEGSASGVFLKVDPGARSTAMGSAYVAAPGDPYSVQFNPAIYADVGKHDGEGAFTHLDIFKGVSYQNLSVMSPVDEYIGSGGLHATMLDYGSQNRTLLGPGGSSDPLTGRGSFTAGDVELSAGWGRQWTQRLALGASVGYIREDIAGFSDKAFSLDLGARYTIVENQLRLGFAARNMGGDIQLNKASDPLPRVYDAGMYYHRDFKSSNTQFNLGLDYVIASDADQFIKIGTELGFWNTFFMRAGFKDDQEADQGFTFGLGLNVGRFRVDFSSVKLGDLGRHKTLSVTYDFGSERRSQKKHEKFSAKNEMQKGRDAYKKSDFRNARRRFQRVIEQDESNNEARNWLAATHQKMGNNRKARELWNRVLKTDPENEVARKNLVKHTNRERTVYTN